MFGRRVDKLGTAEMRNSLWLKGEERSSNTCEVLVMKEHGETEIAISARNSLGQIEKGFECSIKEPGSH